MFIYKVVSSNTGLEELEKKVTESMNKGWKPQGGIAFSHGFCYQAMIGKKSESPASNKKEKKLSNNETNTANQAMKRLDELT